MSAVSRRFLLTGAALSTASLLVPIGSVAEKSNTPTSKYVIISVKLAAEQSKKFNYEHADGGA